MQISTIKRKMINEDKWESSTNWNMEFFMSDQNILFGYTPPMEKIEKSKNVKQFIFMNVPFFIDPFLLKEYHLFSQKIESSLEQ